MPDRTLTETIAEGRRLIAEATADRVLPLKKTVREGYNTLIEADGAPLAMTDGDGSAYVEDCAVDVVAFAVAHLPALLDVAEAAKRALDGFPPYADPMTPEELGVDGRYVRLTVGDVRRLQRALSALALGPDGEGKEKGNG